MKHRTLVWLIPLALACRNEKGDGDTAAASETGDLPTDDSGDCVSQYWFLDADGDGYGTEETVEACEQPSGYAEVAGDCDDEDPNVNPGAEEICDEIDNDCDGLIDTNQAGDELCVLDDAAIKLTGEALEEMAGFMVASAGDVNGDGYDELLVGAPYNDRGGEDSGSVYMLLGPVTASQELATADWIFTGESAGDGAGVGSGGRDVTGDGAPDLVIGAHWEATNGTQAGAAYLWTDLAGVEVGEISLAEADAKLLGEAADDWAGEFVALTDDVDGDGIGDLLVSADRADPNGNESGLVYLLHPPLEGEISLGDAPTRFIGASAGDRIGRSIADLGDLDGDGQTELGIGGVGLNESSGRLYIAYGDTWSGDIQIGDLDVQLAGESTGDQAAHMVTGVRDIDGDGYADFALSAPYSDRGAEDGGAVYIYFQAPAGESSLADADLIVTSDRDGDTCGSHGSDGVGDVDADGYDDLVIGVNNDDETAENAGAAYLIVGPVSASGEWLIDDLAVSKYLGESADEEAGVAVSAAGDTNGDGYDDFLVGGAETFGEDVGVAYLILGGER